MSNYPLVTDSGTEGNIANYNPCPELKINDSSMKVYDENNVFNIPDYIGQKPTFFVSLDNIKTDLNDPRQVPLTNMITPNAAGKGVEVHSRNDNSLPVIFKDADWIAPKKVFHPCDEKYIIKSLNGLSNTNDKEEIKQIVISEKLNKLSENPFKKIANFPNVEFIKLKGINLSRIHFKSSGDDPVFKNVLWIDISDNNINDDYDILKLVKVCPKLQSIDFRRNPCVKKDLIYRILRGFPNINNINGQIVDFAKWKEAILDDPKQIYNRNNGLVYFKHVVMSIPELRYASTKFKTKFDPSILLHLSLPNAMITTFDVHEFVRLQSLNLSNNNISSLVNSGIDFLGDLISVNLENNNISKLREFDVFKSCALLQHLKLQGNPIKLYRSKLIAKLRNLCGTAALNGIQSIDGVPVSLEEFLHAIGELKPYDYHTLIREKWIRNVERVVGNCFSSKPQQFGYILHKIKVLSLENRGLHQVDLYHLKNITILSLKNNFLTKVHNLHLLTQVVFLDLSGNKFLEIYTLLEQIKHCKFLRYLLIAHDC
jgi:hypothetical protein